jgi:hypothetical protein
MTDLSPTMQAIANHIHASAEARRQGELEDWKLIPKGSEFPSYDAMDDALVAVCAARPADGQDLAIWQKYLRSIEIPAKIDGCTDLSRRVVAALIGAES